MALTPKEMNKAILANLPTKTGKTLQEWLKLLQAQGPEGKRERVAWLKTAHGLGHFQAEAIVQEAEGGSPYQAKTADELIDAQYSGRKEALRPIFDELVRTMKKLGPDVRIEPCKTYASVLRNRQFAVIRPSTATRVDLGLALPGVPAGGKLRPVKSLGGSARITHSIPLSDVRGVDKELVSWARRAYELDA